MNVLQKYNKENPEMLSEDSPCSSSGEYDPLVCTLINSSGGRIKNVRQANMVLAVVAAIIFGISFFIVLNGGSNNSLSDLKVYKYNNGSNESIP